MACDTEWSAADKNFAETLVFDCALFILATFSLLLVLWRFISTLVRVITSDTLGGTTNYVLMGFVVLLLLIISSNTGALSESYE